MYILKTYEKFTDKDLGMIKNFYSHYYSSKDEAEVVGWHSKKVQEKRFEILLNIGVQNGETVLDFGCGLGALYEYMYQRYDDFGYIGVDINNKFIQKCKERYPTIRFQTISDITEVQYPYDWFISSGAFSVYTPKIEMLQTVKVAYKQAKYGLAMNFLESTYAENSDLESVRGYDKKEIEDLFFEEFGNVKVIDNYLNIDFTIYIRK